MSVVGYRMTREVLESVRQGGGATTYVFHVAIAIASDHFPPSLSIQQIFHAFAFGSLNRLLYGYKSSSFNDVGHVIAMANILV